MWISRHIKTKAGRGVVITTKDVVVIFATPIVLIVSIHTKLLSLNVVSAHAPHAGRAEEFIKEWWATFTAEVEKAKQQRETVIMFDTNAHLRCELPGKVESRLASKQNIPGDQLEAFLVDLDFSLPSTILSYNAEPLLPTCMVNGFGSIIDFVAISTTRCASCLRAGRLDDFDLSMKNTDHFAVFIDVILARYSGEGGGWRRTKLCDYISISDASMMADIAANLEALPCIPWQLDVHSHAHIIEQHVKQAFECHDRDLPKPRKAYISDQAFNLILVKAAWFKEVARFTKRIRAVLLRVCLVTWFEVARGSLGCAGRRW